MLVFTLDISSKKHALSLNLALYTKKLRATLTFCLCGKERSSVKWKESTDGCCPLLSVNFFYWNREMVLLPDTESASDFPVVLVNCTVSIIANRKCLEVNVGRRRTSECYSTEMFFPWFPPVVARKLLNWASPLVVGLAICEIPPRQFVCICTLREERTWLLLLIMEHIVLCLNSCLRVFFLQETVIVRVTFTQLAELCALMMSRKKASIEYLSSCMSNGWVPLSSSSCVIVCYPFYWFWYSFTLHLVQGWTVCLSM